MKVDGLSYPDLLRMKELMKSCGAEPEQVCVMHPDSVKKLGEGAIKECGVMGLKVYESKLCKKDEAYLVSVPYFKKYRDELLDVVRLET